MLQSLNKMSLKCVAHILTVITVLGAASAAQALTSDQRRRKQGVVPGSVF